MAVHSRWRIRRSRPESHYVLLDLHIMKKHVLRLVVLLTCVAVFWAAPAARAGGGGVPPGTTPVAGPVEVLQVSTEATTPGGFVAADVLVVNSSSEVTVRGALRSAVTFADGSRQRLVFPQPLILGPDGAIMFQLALPVPKTRRWVKLPWG